MAGRRGRTPWQEKKEGGGRAVKNYIIKERTAEEGHEAKSWTCPPLHCSYQEGGRSTYTTARRQKNSGAAGAPASCMAALAKAGKRHKRQTSACCGRGRVSCLTRCCLPAAFCGAADARSRQRRLRPLPAPPPPPSAAAACASATACLLPTRLLCLHLPAISRSISYRYQTGA